MRCSLLEPVVERYADPNVSAADEQAMSPAELLNYIRESDHQRLPPLEAILAQTEAIGDPALPTTEQVAILRWLGSAQQEWERHFPVEEPLASKIRQLRPLTAALAVSSPDFLAPGAHPMHQILDTIQAAAIGWQPRLGRAGKALERQINKLVEAALTWFEDGETDLQELGATLASAAERELTRSRRMSRRVVETEQVRVRTAAAKQQAAQMINTELEQFKAPAGIGEFLKGHWYASAQLVLLKYGEDSEEWQQMSATTHTLLDSMQSPEGADEQRRQHILQVATEMPREIKRWLLNLHHDSEAVDDTVGLVEFVHLRIMRQQPVDLVKIDPIPLDQEPGSNETSRSSDNLDDILTGQWFVLPDTEGPLRAQLALKMDEEQQLLFTNQAGIKALQLSYQEFVQARARNMVTPLAADCSFSWCLADAVGLGTVEALEDFTGATAEKARREEEERQRQIEEAERLEQERLEVERLERERIEAERQEQERLERERIEAEQREQARLEQERIEAEQREQARLEQERIEAERQAQEPLEREKTELEQQQEKIDEYLRQKQERRQRRAQEAEATKSASPADSAEQAAINLPMGAWLSFHDGETPLLAKLAVHDTEQDLYFFVNRLGIKMRQLSSAELLDLAERGLVDILEANSSFREEVSRMRNDQQE